MRYLLLILLLTGCGDDTPSEQVAPAFTPQCVIAGIADAEYDDGEIRKSELYICQDKPKNICHSIVYVNDYLIYNTDCEGLAPPYGKI